MSKRISILAAAGVLLVAGLAVAFAQTRAPQRGTRGTAKPQKVLALGDDSHIPPPWRLAKDPAQVYTVKPIPVRGKIPPRTQQQDQLLQQAADIVARVRPVPAERLQFFAWMERPDSPVTFAGWGSFVESVAPTPEGWLVTLWVTPFANWKHGGIALVGNCYIERYLWSNGVLQFVGGFAHPDIGAEPSLSSM